MAPLKSNRFVRRCFAATCLLVLMVHLVFFSPGSNGVSPQDHISVDEHDRIVQNRERVLAPHTNAEHQLRPARFAQLHNLANDVVTTSPQVQEEAVNNILDLLYLKLWYGDQILVIGENIEFAINRLCSMGQKFTIVGAEMNHTTVEEEGKRQRRRPRNVLDEHGNNITMLHFQDATTDLSIIQAASIDAMIVWDLRSTLYMNESFKHLAVEARRLLRDTSPGGFAVFAFSMAGVARRRTTGGIRAAFPPSILQTKRSHLLNGNVYMLFHRPSPVATQDSDWISSKHLRSVEPQQFLDKCHSSSEYLRELDVLLRVTADVLEECGITYWLDSGTLLGAYRFNAYNPMEDDHDLVVDHDEFIEQTPKFRRLITERLHTIHKKPFFKAINANATQYETKIGQLWMSSDGTGTLGFPQVDLITAKWAPNLERYDLTATWFQRHTQNGFPKNVLFTQTEQVHKTKKWKTKHGYLGALPILGREYPTPFDVEGYTAVWYWPSNFMHNIVMRQMKNNPLHHEFCQTSVARIYAARHPAFVQQMVKRMKEVFPSTFNDESCPLCQCTVADCSVQKTEVALD